MAIFAVMHIFAFPWRPYDISKSSNPNDHYQGGFLGFKALLDAFNPWDIIKASARGFRWLFVGIRKRHHDPSYTMETAPSSKKASPLTLSNATTSRSTPAPTKMQGDDYDDMSSTPHNAFPPSPIKPIAPLLPTGVLSQTSGRQTDGDDYNDRAALLAHSAHPPSTRNVPYILSSGESTPYRQQSPPPTTNGQAFALQPSGYLGGDSSRSYPSEPLGRMDSPPSPLDEPHAITASHAITVDERVTAGSAPGYEQRWPRGLSQTSQQWPEQTWPHNRPGEPPPGWR